MMLTQRSKTPHLQLVQRSIKNDTYKTFQIFRWIHLNFDIEQIKGISLVPLNNQNTGNGNDNPIAR